MFKDKDKQKEANRKAQAKFKAKGITEGITEGITGRVLPEDVPAHGLTAGFENTVFVKPERTAQGIKDELDLKPNKIFKACEKRLAKRGKDIKSFGDLPMDVQATIDRLSVVDGKINDTIKANRTAIAVNYQHQFPDRFHSTGVAI